MAQDMLPLTLRPPEDSLLSLLAGFERVNHGVKLCCHLKKARVLARASTALPCQLVSCTNERQATRDRCVPQSEHAGKEGLQ